jgi:predicted molibdopterin-dependent oxidoreductase YjgC
MNGTQAIQIIINGEQFPASEGQSVLEVARRNAIHIPTLCFHPALKPSGACKLCAVEVVGPSGRQVAMLACILKARDGLKVATTGDVVQKARTRAFMNLARTAPQSNLIRRLAEENGIDLGSPPDGCIRCRLCVRVCKEVVGAGALTMEKRAGVNTVVPVEGRCIGCGTCANLCPTKIIQVEDCNNVRTIAIRDEIIGRHPLERCQGCGKLYATAKFVAFTEKRVSPHPLQKEQHHYCATCAKLFSDRLRTLRDRSPDQRLPGHHG